MGPAGADRFRSPAHGRDPADAIGGRGREAEHAELVDHHRPATVLHPTSDSPERLADALFGPRLFKRLVERSDRRRTTRLAQRGDKLDQLRRQGTEYLAPERFQQFLTSRQLKVKAKGLNISGLQIADLIAGPSRNEILSDHSLITLMPDWYSDEVINILQEKYDRVGDKVYGKKLL